MCQKDYTESKCQLGPNWANNSVIKTLVGCVTNCIQGFHAYCVDMDEGNLVSILFIQGEHSLFP